MTPAMAASNLDQPTVGILVACLLCLLGCLAVLGIVVKLYTEILKEKAISRRTPAAAVAGERAGRPPAPTPLRGGGPDGGP
jgi:hypothetical protein